MDFKKRFNYDDKNIFLFDGKTVATEDFYRKKYNNKLPDYYYKYMEALARPEFNEQDIKKIKEQIIDFKKEYVRKIDLEFKQATLINIDNDDNNNLNINNEQ
jgi:predicted ThiF/HesA family dinucleotide-utilizing enzyme